MSTSPVDDFGLRLEGLLDQQRNDVATSSVREPAREIPRSNSIDFSLAGMEGGSSAMGSRVDTPAGTDADTEAGREADLSALNTKLELAMACKEIGDLDGARELLAEVSSSSHPELARRAQSLLQQLA